MPKITALIHSHDCTDALRLARALDSLRPCDQVVVVDHGQSAEVQRVCREHGATVKTAITGVSPGAYLMDARNDWILCLLPNESLTEALEASLLEWKNNEHDPAETYGAAIRAEDASGWHSLPPETRLVNRNTVNWTGDLPPSTAKSKVLEGELLRFASP
ncbi:MAG: hypothetical protein ACE14L_06250 [Terriglobales bacterium]